MVGGDGKGALIIASKACDFITRKGDAQYVPVLALVLESFTNLCLACLACRHHLYCACLCSLFSASLLQSSSSELWCKPQVSASCHGRSTSLQPFAGRECLTFCCNFWFVVASGCALTRVVVFPPLHASTYNSHTDNFSEVSERNNFFSMKISS